MPQLKVRYYDYSDDTANINWELAPGSLVADAQSVLAGINGLVRGTQGEALLVNDELADAGSTARPASPDAQREDKWLITYRDTVNQNSYRLSLPTADRTLLPGGSEELPATDAAYIAFKAAFDANVVSPYGNAVELTSIKYIAVAL